MRGVHKTPNSPLNFEQNIINSKWDSANVYRTERGKCKVDV